MTGSSDTISFVDIICNSYITDGRFYIIVVF